jgi:hypothetical protein
MFAIPLSPPAPEAVAGRAHRLGGVNSLEEGVCDGEPGAEPAACCLLFVARSATPALPQRAGRRAARSQPGKVCARTEKDHRAGANVSDDDDGGGGGGVDGESVDAFAATTNTMVG